MQFFPLLEFQHWVLAVLLGLGAVILTCMAFGARKHESEREDLEDLNTDKGSHLNLLSQFKTNPHGLFLVLLYLGILLWVIAYYFLVGTGGPIT